MTSRKRTGAAVTLAMAVLSLFGTSAALAKRVDPPHYDGLDAAKSQAQAKGGLLLVDFSTDW